MKEVLRRGDVVVMWNEERDEMLKGTVVCDQVDKYAQVSILTLTGAKDYVARRVVKIA